MRLILNPPYIIPCIFHIRLGSRHRNTLLRNSVQRKTSGAAHAPGPGTFSNTVKQPGSFRLFSVRQVLVLRRTFPWKAGKFERALRIRANATWCDADFFTRFVLQSGMLKIWLIPKLKISPVYQIWNIVQRSEHIFHSRRHYLHNCSQSKFTVSVLCSTSRQKNCWMYYDRYSFFER